MVGKTTRPQDSPKPPAKGRPQQAFAELLLANADLLDELVHLVEDRSASAERKERLCAMTAAFATSLRDTADGLQS